MKNTLYYISILVLVFSCRSMQSAGQNEGVAMMHHYLIEKDTILDIHFKVFFFDRQSVQEVPQLDMNENQFGKSASIKVLHYSYLNPQKNICVNFSEFSDSARPLKCYANADSVFVGGGWNFYSTRSLRYDIKSYLRDTAFDGNTYNMFRLQDLKSPNNTVFVAYVNCQRKDFPLKFFYSFDDPSHCLIERIDTYQNGVLVMISKMDIIANKLSGEQRHIFQKWATIIHCPS